MIVRGDVFTRVTNAEHDSQKKIALIFSLAQHFLLHLFELQDICLSPVIDVFSKRKEKKHFLRLPFYDTLPVPSLASLVSHNLTHVAGTKI